MNVLRAIVVIQFGGPEVLTVSHVDSPEPGPGQVSIDVAFAGVNFAEVMGRRGQIGSITLPFIPGLEVSGAIRAVGSGVDGLAAGDRVSAFTGVGGYAEVAVADARRVVRLDRGRLGGCTRADSPAGTIDLPTSECRLDDVVEVHRALEGGSTSGKTVIRLSGEG